MTKYYGNFTNRSEEGKNYLGREIQVGDDITSYSYSDRSCYYITKVIDQQHIFVKEYSICANLDKACGMGHQDWLCFKTHKEIVDYLTSKGLDITYNEECEPIEEEWKIYRGKWCRVTRWKLEEIRNENNEFIMIPNFTAKEYAKLENGKEVVKYMPINNISFGVRDYYYDWEF